jgi:hypothetical protein
MNSEYLPPAEIERQRNAWFRQRAKPGMTLDEYICLNEETLDLFPPTNEERHRKAERLMAMPEFIL